MDRFDTKNWLESLIQSMYSLRKERSKNAVLVSDFDLFVGGGAEMGTLKRREVSWRSPGEDK